MARTRVQPTGREVRFGEHELIVSKTDPKGRITYCNDVFRRVSGFTEEELLGQPHSIIRHPDMPRCVFKLLWDTIAAGHEIFAYVDNLARNGDHYWVFAHVTPSFDASGAVVGYHSNRRVPRADAVRRMTALYADLRAVEERAENRRIGMQDGYRAVVDLLRDKGVDYDRFVLGL